jgi:hypothetical protein
MLRQLLDRGKAHRLAAGHGHSVVWDDGQWTCTDCCRNLVIPADGEPYGSALEAQCEGSGR